MNETKISHYYTPVLPHCSTTKTRHEGDRLKIGLEYAIGGPLWSLDTFMCLVVDGCAVYDWAIPNQSIIICSRFWMDGNKLKWISITSYHSPCYWRCVSYSKGRLKIGPVHEMPYSHELMHLPGSVQYTLRTTVKGVPLPAAVARVTGSFLQSGWQS